MQVDKDFICDHGMPTPWASCTECMFLPGDQRPKPPRIVVEKRSPSAASSASKGSMPKTASDPWPQLNGNKDLSYPVHDIRAHTEGPGNEWLFGEHGFPKHLRPGGWVYLRSDGKLGARARIRGVGFRETRIQHTGDSDDWGPGSTLEVDPKTWEILDEDLGELAESQRQGYRYLITSSDGTITHLSATDAVPDDIAVGDALPAKLYTLLNESGRSISSWIPGTIAGNGRDKIWGNFDCPAALKAISDGDIYEGSRVFFADIETATAAGFRPCGRCRTEEFEVWKAGQAG